MKQEELLNDFFSSPISLDDDRNSGEVFARVYDANPAYYFALKNNHEVVELLQSLICRNETYEAAINGYFKEFIEKIKKDNRDDCLGYDCIHDYYIYRFKQNIFKHDQHDYFDELVEIIKLCDSVYQAVDIITQKGEIILRDWFNQLPAEKKKEINIKKMAKWAEICTCLVQLYVIERMQDFTFQDLKNNDI